LAARRASSVVFHAALLVRAIEKAIKLPLSHRQL
jgi:hypothetical protein